MNRKLSEYALSVYSGRPQFTWNLYKHKDSYKIKSGFSRQLLVMAFHFKRRRICFEFQL